MKGSKTVIVFAFFVVGLLVVSVGVGAVETKVTEADVENFLIRFVKASFRAVAEFFNSMFGGDSVDESVEVAPVVDVAIEDFTIHQDDEVVYSVTEFRPFDVVVKVVNNGDEPIYPVVHAKVGWQNATVEPGVIYNHAPASITYYFNSMSEGEYELEIKIDPLEGETNFENNVYVYPLRVNSWTWS